jgi:hypothetical protein
MEYNLLYDKSVLLLPDATTFSFSVSPVLIGPAWKFKIVLSDDTYQDPFTSNTAVDNNNNITITLYRWYSDNWVENADPIEIISKGTVIKLAIKIRVAMNQYQPQKHIIVTVWKQG